MSDSSIKHAMSLVPKLNLSPTFKEQMLHVFSAAVAGPSLIYAGYKFNGSVAAKIFLASSGVLLLYSHHKMLKEMLATADAQEFKLKSIASSVEAKRIKSAIAQVAAPASFVQPAPKIASAPLPPQNKALSFSPSGMDSYVAPPPPIEEVVMEETVEDNANTQAPIDDNLSFDLNDFAGFFG